VAGIGRDLAPPEVGTVMARELALGSGFQRRRAGSGQPAAEQHWRIYRTGASLPQQRSDGRGPFGVGGVVDQQHPTCGNRADQGEDAVKLRHWWALSAITTGFVRTAPWGRRRRSGPPAVAVAAGRVARRDRLGGLLHEYAQVA
jgi:hypothetical protein